MATASLNPLVVGGIRLTTPNAPQELGLGAVEQRKTVTELVGGGRVVSTYGPQPKPVTIKGTLYAPDVAANLATLRAYVVDGRERLIEWTGERYYAKFVDFTPTYRYGGQLCDYEFTIEVTRDANGAFTVAQQTNVDQQIASLQDTATVTVQQIAAAVAADSTVPALTGVNIADISVQLQNMGPVGQASSSDVSTLVTSIQSSLASATSYLGALSQTSAAFIPASRLVNALQLILDNVQVGQAQRVITKTGGSLFETAATYYGDVTRAFDIQSINALPSPYLPAAAQTTLRLPPYSVKS